MVDPTKHSLGRDTIMKMLLNSRPVVPATSTVGSGLPSPTGDTYDDNPNRLTTYLHQLGGCYEIEVDVIVKDHCYARPWNWKPENVYVKPVKKLFFSKLKNSSTDKLKQDQEVDVEGEVQEPCAPPYDLARARHVMDEFQRLSDYARPEENDDWEEKVDKTLWSPVQNRIFTKVTRILTSERLVRLVKSNSAMEPVFRRICVDTAAKRFRETLASASWDWRIAQWLHNMLFENLPHEYLAIYLDILQTLRQKIPQLIDKMIAVQPSLTAKVGPITWETLGPLLKRSWDPVASSLNVNRPKKLPGNPILVIAPTGVGSSVSSRQHRWISQLGALGMVVNVHTHMGMAANRMTMMACVDQMVQATRAKIQDVRGDCPGRPVVLVGFNTGAALACQVAQMEHVTAVVCLGFPFTTVEGKRGTPDDTLMDIRCPVMFVIGQNATLARAEDLEELREKMLVETSLVVVGTADDHLRISTAKKISEGITQSMVDRCLLDEIGDFIGGILLQPHPLPLRPASLASLENKGTKKEVRKRKNSTSSSVESEPNSPNVKKSRPATPVAPSATATAASGSAVASAPPPLPRSGTLTTQPTLVTVSGPNLTHASTSKRKPRVTSNQKINNPERVISPRHAAAQQNTNGASGGITLNIGSLASLAPMGPIRLAPSTAGSQTVPCMTKARTSPAYSKMQKIGPSNLNPQSLPKMKTVVSTKQSFSKVISNNYKHINITDKGGEAKMVNVLTTAGNQMRVSASTAAAIHAKSMGSTSGALSALFQSGRSPMGTVARTTSASSILLTPGISNANTIVPSMTTTAAKAMDTAVTGSSLGRPVSNTGRAMDAAKVFSMLPAQASTSGKGFPVGTSSGTVTTPRNASMLMPISSQNPITILPLSNRTKTPQRSTKTVPKITVNSCGPQRSHRAKPQSPMRKKPANELDDDLGNILDIPIIFAKDGENLNAMEKTPVTCVSQAPVTIDTYDRNVSKLGPTTKVVLISNKQEKMQQPMKLANRSMQTVVRPPMRTTVSCTVPQARSASLSVPTINRTGIPIHGMGPGAGHRTGQPTIKYTKIILAKRNSVPIAGQDDRGDQVVLTKNTQKPPTPIPTPIPTPTPPLVKILSYDKNEHRYAQMLPRTQTRYQESIPDDALEIEDAIKTNIIERKVQSIPQIDLTSPKKGLKICESARSMIYNLHTARPKESFDDPAVSDSRGGTELLE